jgi:hypothetical protein
VTVRRQTAALLAGASARGWKTWARWNAASARATAEGDLATWTKASRWRATALPR